MQRGPRAACIESRDWGLAHLDVLADAGRRDHRHRPDGCAATISATSTIALSYRHLAGLTDFFRRLAQDGLVPDGSAVASSRRRSA